MKILTKFTILLFLTVCTSTIYAQNTEEVRNVSNFKGIRISSGIDLYIRQGSVESVRIVGDKDKLEKVKTEKEGDILRIYTGNSKGWFNFDFFTLIFN